MTDEATPVEGRFSLWHIFMIYLRKSYLFCDKLQV